MMTIDNDPDGRIRVVSIALWKGMKSPHRNTHSENEWILREMIERTLSNYEGGK
jgi:hypothetical protein